jgi:uncharacterized pyridoxamine 5'-phosphate oxidase family protein
MTPQRRGRAIAMAVDEIDDFLSDQRTVRVATVGQDGSPHVVPLWYVWVDGRLWLNSLTRSQRWTDIQRDPRVAAIVDAGVEYHELRGVELRGRAVAVGDIPRTTAPVPELGPVEQAFAQKYNDSQRFQPDGRHAWLAMRPASLRSWDFRKNPQLRSK